MMKKILAAVLVFLIFTAGSTPKAEEIETSIEVKASETVNKFIPKLVFGNNTSGWADPRPVKDRIQEAGNYVLRYPGGSWGDGFFWNSAGKYDADGNWEPSLTEYANSTTGELRFGPDKIIDDDDSTAWKSNRDTDYPNAQWIYAGLGGLRKPDRVVITWGNKASASFPYARKFTVQFWDSKEGRQWMPYGADRNAWLNTSAADVAGKGGVQEVRFRAVDTQYIRILMTESSAGGRGAYSVASLKVFEKGEEIPITDKNNIVASSSDTAATLGNGASWIFGFESYMGFMNSFSPVKAEPLIIVNLGSGTPQMAAAWVKYANKIKNYGIKYWEIGNENGGQWEVGGPLNMYDYTRRYIKFYEAMKAEDPSITIIGQAQSDGNSQAYDGKTAIEAFLSRLAKEKKLHYAEGLVSHHYPTWDMHVNDLLVSPAKQMKQMQEQVDTALKKYPSLKDIPVWMTEFNTSDHVKPHDMSVRLENGLWLAQYLPEFAKNFGLRARANLWDVLNGGSAISEEKGGDHGYMQAEAGEYQYQERADYWVMKMLTNYWSSAGDEKEHSILSASTPADRLAVYANKKPDNTLALLVVNVNDTYAYRAKISIEGYELSENAKVWEFDSSHYAWRTETKPYHADPSDAPSSRDIKASNEFTHVFKPYSISVIEMKPKQ